MTQIINYIAPPTIAKFRQRRKPIPPLQTTHGRSYSVEYSAWGMMKQRCLNLRCHAYDRYGGRGITVCERWLVFENFLADMGSRPAGLTLERKDNNAGYSPENCVWATRSAQQRNRNPFSHRRAA